MAKSVFRYKNISDQEQSVMGLGVVKPGGILESDWPVQNPNFEPIEKEESRKRGSK